MIPAARIQAAIELLDALHESRAGEGPSFEGIARRYFAKRRYAGSSDRREIRQIVYKVLRNYQALAWRLEAAGGPPVTGRRMILAGLVSKAEKPAAFFTGANHAPDALDENEIKLIETLGANRDVPEWARLNCPQWLYPQLEKRFGGSLELALQALNDRAPVGLRINRLKVNRESVIPALRGDGIRTTGGAYAGDALIVVGAANLAVSNAYRDGWVEVQDEGSQIAAILVAAEPGMTVVDYCAGAGGKTLALATAMENSGRIIACDVDAVRLSELKRRRKRGGVDIVKITKLEPGEGISDGGGQLASLRGRADRVLVDAPCSGSGTWRRQPELRLRFDEKRLAALVAMQGRLLDEAAELVAPGGRLIYVTCSLLAAENEECCADFLKQRAGWQQLDWRPIWSARQAKELAESVALEPQALQLAPHVHGTDGFFVGIFEAPTPCRSGSGAP